MTRNKVEIEGLAEVQARINEAVEDVEGNARKGLVKAMNIVERESKQQVPVDNAVLKNSWDSGWLDKYTRYGSYNTKYAIIQHERTDFEHSEGQKAKYLEDPLKNNVRKIIKTIREAAEIE